MQPTLGEFSAAVTAQVNAFASAWSEAGNTFARQVAAEGGQAVVSSQRQKELLAQALGNEFKTLADSSERWAAAAADQHKTAIAEQPLPKSWSATLSSMQLRPTCCSTTFWTPT